MCRDGNCRAEFSAFCLQRDRFAPAPGTRYHLASDSAVQLVGSTANGRKVVLDPQRHLEIESLRAHLAVRLAVSPATLRRFDIEKVAVEVGSNVLLLPVASPGDRNPHTVAEIAVLTQSLRPLGAMMVDGNRERMIAARITSRIINALPESGRTSMAAGEDLWQRAVDGTNIPTAAVGWARGSFELCKWAVSRGSLTSLRRCLEAHHDGFLQYLNSDYWKAVKVGS